jgi:S-DNA-T family DNA segregation ATPase FtsK/SpoIIIE
LVADYSTGYLGYLSYVYLLVLLYPLYKFNFSYIEKGLEKSIAYIFLIFTLLIFQSLVVDGNMSGKLGNIIVDEFAPYIGIVGVWFFVLIGFFVSFLILFEGEFEKLMQFISNLKLKSELPKPEQSQQNIRKNSYEPKQVYQEPIPDIAPTVEIKKDENIVLKEMGDTAEIVLDQYEDEEESFEEKLFKQKIQEDPLEHKIIQTQKKQTPQEQKQDDKDIEEPMSSKLKNSIIVEELEENKKFLEDIELGEVVIPKNFQLPPTNIFQEPKDTKLKINEEFIDKKIKDLLEKLKMFKIEGDVVRTYTGPIVTTFEFKPALNVKVSKILNLQDDLAMALKAQTIRLQAPIPGKDVVGIEVPNEEAQTIYLRELLESELFANATSPLTMILGKDIVGKPFIADLKKLPHLLIAGTTGSGKSVGLNSMILSLLYKNSPDRLKLIMIDPKMIEFSIYNDIPHLLTPVIIKPTEAINALANMVAEMEKRYVMMAETRTKNIDSYNEKVKAQGKEEMPYIVIIIDELADLMMTSGKEVEISIARIAQKARACGIHLVVATQRPSVDVVTGLIKANLPSRISYKVGQKVDSKIILDSLGAESLLGRGDMLFTPPGMSGLVRVHAPWSDEKEIEEVVEFLKAQREASYDVSLLKESAEDGFAGDVANSGNNIGDLDELYEQAKLVVIQDKKSSISYLQRRLKIGYNRSATIIEQLEQTGILSAPNSKGNREILV